MLSWMLIAFLACEEKQDEFSVLAGTSDEPSDELPDEDTSSDSEPAAEDTATEPLTEEDCMPMDETANADPNTLEGIADCGYFTYSRTCANCHGDDGMGTPNGQQLVGHIEGHDDADLIDSIVNGEGTMPPYDMMHPQSVADVVAYMRREFQ